MAAPTTQDELLSAIETELNARGKVGVKMVKIEPLLRRGFDEADTDVVLDDDNIKLLKEMLERFKTTGSGKASTALFTELYNAREDKIARINLSKIDTYLEVMDASPTYMDYIKHAFGNDKNFRLNAKKLEEFSGLIEKHGSERMKGVFNAALTDAKKTRSAELANVKNVKSGLENLADGAIFVEKYKNRTGANEPKATIHIGVKKLSQTPEADSTDNQHLAFLGTLTSQLPVDVGPFTYDKHTKTLILPVDGASTEATKEKVQEILKAIANPNVKENINLKISRERKAYTGANKSDFPPLKMPQPIKDEYGIGKEKKSYVDHLWSTVYGRAADWVSSKGVGFFMDKIVRGVAHRASQLGEIAGAVMTVVALIGLFTGMGAVPAVIVGALGLALGGAGVAGEAGVKTWQASVDERRELAKKEKAEMQI